MSAMHAVQPGVRAPARERLPRRSKAKLYDTEGTNATRKLSNKDSESRYLLVEMRVDLNSDQ
jgi:hypothetical protein